ncbi:hypothetical protein [Streptomyces lavendulae]|uniref:hypothetical protein n=1 Tax=Streptomyces lavendulae TaxID=1914 RepID=UPI0031E83F95
MSTAAQHPHPHLAVVPPMPTQPPAPLEGVLVEKTAAVEEAALPGWLQAASTHVVEHHGYLPWVGRGYRRAAGLWVDRYHDDFPQMIATARQEARKASADKQGDAKKLVKQRRAEYRIHRLTHVGVTGAWTLAGGTGIAVGTMTGSLWVDVAAAVGAYLYGLRHGHREDSQPLAVAGETPAALPSATGPSPAAEFFAAAGPQGVTAAAGGTSIEKLPAATKPFPVRQATTPEQLAVCVLAALRKESIPVAEVFDISRQPWGWQCTVRVSEGTPAAIIKASGDLETVFDLGTNGVRVQPLRSRRACAILRLVESNPFAGAPDLPYRAPHSLSITDRTRVGTSVGGDPLEIALSQVMTLVVAASGGGKTGLLQALAEVTTACRDNITIDLDPHGDGLEDLGDAARIVGRSHEQIEAVLLFFLMMSKARARLRAKLGMGKKWISSPEHPHVTIFFDEFPKGSEVAKALAVMLLLVGRKEAVTLIIASQGATKSFLGESFAQNVPLKIVGPCKAGDTRGVFGDTSVAEGWLPHALSPATDIDPKDAGHVYLQGIPGRPDEPIEYAVHETPSATLRQLAEERLQAGLLEPDQDSLSAMADVDLPDADDLPPLLSWPALLRLCGAHPSAGQASAHPIVAEALAVMDERKVDRMRTEALAEALHLAVGKLKAQMSAAGVPDPSGIGPTDGLQNPRGYKRETLASA